MTGVHLYKAKLVALISKDSISRSEIEHYSGVLRKALKNKEVQQKLLVSLLRGGTGDRESLQEEMWRITEKLIEEECFGENEKMNVSILISHLKERELSASLRKSLVNIEKIERVLVTLNNIFKFLQKQYRQKCIRSSKID